MERENTEEKYLSMNILDLFLINHKRVFYSLNEKSENIQEEKFNS